MSLVEEQSFVQDQAQFGWTRPSDFASIRRLLQVTVKKISNRSKELKQLTMLANAKATKVETTMIFTPQRLRIGACTS